MNVVFFTGVGKAVQCQHAILEVCIAALRLLDRNRTAVVNILPVTQLHAANFHDLLFYNRLTNADCSLCRTTSVGVCNRIRSVAQIQQDRALRGEDCKRLVKLGLANGQCARLPVNGQVYVLALNGKKPFYKNSNRARIHGSNVQRAIKHGKLGNADSNGGNARHVDGQGAFGHVKLGFGHNANSTRFTAHLNAYGCTDERNVFRLDRNACR